MSGRAGAPVACYTVVMPELRLHPRDVRAALRRRDQVDPWFVGKYGLSPYQACAQGCAYCDGRAERYFIEGEFDHDIVVRQNIAAVLAHELPRLRERGIVFIGSGVSDAYQDPEAAGGLMRACGEILAERNFPVTVLTKSTLLGRDLELWAEVNARAGFTCMVSLCTLDDDLRRALEPLASPIEERLAMLAAFKARGCATGVAMMPLLPGLSDGDAQIGALVTRLAEIGVDFVLPGGLTLRPGRQKEFFFQRLRASYPSLVPHYEGLYAEERPSGSPRRDYAAGLHRRATAALTAAGLPARMPHAIFRGRLPAYDEADVLLQHMADLYAARGRPVARLRQAHERYAGWLRERKRHFNRRRSMRSGALEWELAEMARSGELAVLLANERLAGFLARVLVQREVLDYRTLELRPPPDDPPHPDAA